MFLPTGYMKGDIITKPEILLDEATHIYTVDGVPCESTVTGEIQKSGLWSPPRFSSEEDKKWYQARGKAVHKASALIDRGELNWDTVDERIKGYLQAYMKFKGESGWVFEHREEPLYHTLYKYCGTPDAWYPLTDLKCNDNYNPLQLGGYAELILANGFRRPRTAFHLNLYEDGRYSLNEVKEDLRGLSNVFLALLIVNRYRGCR